MGSVVVPTSRTGRLVGALWVTCLLSCVDWQATGTVGTDADAVKQAGPDDLHVVTQSTNTACDFDASWIDVDSTTWTADFMIRPTAGVLKSVTWKILAGPTEGSWPMRQVTSSGRWQASPGAHTASGTDVLIVATSVGGGVSRTVVFDYLLVQTPQTGDCLEDCVPSTCVQGVAQCGTIDDGCGATLDCGPCNNPDPPCEPVTCAASGSQCGTIDDGCGATLDCGPCGNPDPPCEPATCAADGSQCGTIDDGCGATLNCGPCAPDPPDPVDSVARPSYNTGLGFFVRDGKIYDANGAEFRIRGLNHNTWWGWYSRNIAAIDELAKGRPNTVRAVFGFASGADTPEERRDVVERYIAHGIVPMVEHHGATCETTADQFSAVLQEWLLPENTAWLKRYEEYVILNIANEWGPDSALWRDVYVDAIARLRAAGVNNLIVVDAGGGCSQFPTTLYLWGQEVLASDPQHNVVFGVHMYGYWMNPGDDRVGTWRHGPYDLDAELRALHDTNLPIIIGEFSWQGAGEVAYNTGTAIRLYEHYGIGWLAWSWYENRDPRLNLALSFESDPTDPQQLTEFGRLVFHDPQYGLLNTAERATIFRAP